MDVPDWYDEYRQLRNRADMGGELNDADRNRLRLLEGELQALASTQGNRSPAGPPPPSEPTSPPAPPPTADAVSADLLRRLAQHPDLKRRYGFTADVLAKLDPGFVRQMADALGLTESPPPPADPISPETVERLGQAADGYTAAAAGGATGLSGEESAELALLRSRQSESLTPGLPGLDGQEAGRLAELERRAAAAGKRPTDPSAPFDFTPAGPQGFDFTPQPPGPADPLGLHQRGADPTANPFDLRPPPSSGPSAAQPADPLSREAAGKLGEASDKLVAAAGALLDGARRATDDPLQRDPGRDRRALAKGLDRQRRDGGYLGRVNRSVGTRVGRLFGRGPVAELAGEFVTGRLDRLTGVDRLRAKVGAADDATMAEAKAKKTFEKARGAAEREAKRGVKGPGAGRATNAGGPDPAFDFRPTPKGGAGGGAAAGGAEAAAAGEAAASAEVAGGVAAVAGGEAAGATAAAAASNPVTLAVAAAVAVAAAFYKAQEAVREFAKQQQESNFQLAEFSAGMAGVQANFEAREFRRKQEEGERISGSADQLAQANSEYLEGTKEIRVAVEKLTNLVSAELLRAVTLVLQPLNDIAELVNKLLPEDKSENPLKPLIEEADKESDRRRRQHNEAMERLDLRGRHLRDERFR